MNRYAIIIGLSLVACACSKKEPPGTALPDMSAVRTNLAFSCTHQADHLPPLDPQAEGLFLYARFLEKQDGTKDFNEVARYYRIAAAHGHYKANQNLQSLISDGLAGSPDAPKETVELAVRLIQATISKRGTDWGRMPRRHCGISERRPILETRRRRRMWRNYWRRLIRLRRLPDRCASVLRTRDLVRPQARWVSI